MKGYSQLVILFFFTSIFAQEKNDFIYKDSGEILAGKVLRVGENSVEFDPKGEIPFIIVPRSMIDSIIYSDNQVVNFNYNTSENKESFNTSKLVWKDCEDKDYYIAENYFAYKHNSDEVFFNEKKITDLNNCTNNNILRIKYEIEGSYDNRSYVIFSSSIIEFEPFSIRIYINDNEKLIHSIKNDISDLRINTEREEKIIFDSFNYKGGEFTPILTISKVGYFKEHHLDAWYKESMGFHIKLIIKYTSL